MPETMTAESVNGASTSRLPMQYLSVYDLVWINATLTGVTVDFDYQRLEAAMAAQYSYGVSTNVPVQAANLLEALVVGKPFAYGNRRTGFAATAAFLDANGYALKASDANAAQIVRDLAARKVDSVSTVEALAQKVEIRIRPGVTLRQLVTHILNTHSDAIQSLTEGDEQPDG